MAIRHRRGADSDFDEQKMLAGELAVTTDGTRKVYVAFAPGDVKELAGREYVDQNVGGLIPMGTIKFTDLQDVTNQVSKYMFNISEDFVTDDTFKEGEGISYEAGTNVYRTADGYWAAMAGGILSRSGDTKDNTVTFINSDSKDATSWTDTDLLASGEKHSALFNKISTMVKNVRYIYKLLGKTDISDIGSGTVTDILQCLKKEKLSIDGDSQNNFVTFDSGDALDSEEEPVEWTEVELLKSGEVHSSIFGKVSKMFRNARYLNKKLLAVSNNLENVVQVTRATDDVFEATKTYAVGDYCIYNNILYRCIADINTAGSWDASNWEATTVLEEQKRVNSNLSKTDVQWNTNLHVLYNDYEATVYCTDAVYISNLQVGSSIVPASTTKVPCLYKDSSGKWYQGIIQYTTNGNFIVQYFTDYPGTSATTATDTGYVLFQMTFKRV